MKTIGALLLTLIFILLASCTQLDRVPQNNEVKITGSGALVSKEIDISDFDQVEAGLYFDLTIHQGENSRVILTSDDNFIEYLQVEQTGNSITLGFKPGHAYDTSEVTLRAEVTIPELSKLEMNGSSHAHIEGYRSQQPLEVELTGSSSLTGDMQLETVVLKTYGSSYVKLSGSGDRLNLEACGSSIADLGDYEAVNADLDVSCNSTVIVDVPGRLEGEASQYAQVFLAVDPQVNRIKVNEYASIQPK